MVHIQNFDEKIKKELKLLDMYLKNLEKVPDEEDHKYYLLTVKFGIEIYRAYLRKNGGNDMSLTIRKAVSEDFTEVYELICELVGSPVGGISFSALREIYQANLLSDIKGQYVADLAGEIVGFISLTFDMRLSEGGKVAVIDELVVKEKQRNNGIGSALVEYAIKLAKSIGCCMVEVATNLRREATHRFYEKNKFVKNGYRFGFDDL